MKSFRQLLRLIHINIILARNGFDKLIVSNKFLSPLKFIIYFNPWTWISKSKLSRGAALRKTLEELGPIFVKFGQALSTRPDILPRDIAAELCKLQDNVRPFDSELVLAIIEATYGRSAYEVFASFEKDCLASASIAQVHAATLQTGESVVVKVLRPNILKTIQQDLTILYTIASMAERYWPEARRFKPKEIVQEFETNLLKELNLRREAANASQLRRNFQNSELLYIPEVFWDYTYENILVLERIHGIPVADVAGLKAAGINIKLLAERGVEIFFTQVFRDCFFHADMHPGNIFVSYEHIQEPQYICIDFGLIGTLTDNDKRYIAENLYAFFNRDYRRVAELHIESGWIARDTRIDEFEADIRMVCEPIFEKPLKDISFGHLVLNLFQVAQRFNMVVQPQLILLQKTLLAIEGLGRQLYPNLDLWATAKPFLEKWLKEQMGPKAFFKQLRTNLPFFAEQLPHMPKLLHEVLALSKEEKILTLAKMNYASTEYRSKSLWQRGFGWGLFISMSAIAFCNYYHIINFATLTKLSLIAAGLGGVIAILSLRI